MTIKTKVKKTKVIKRQMKKCIADLAAQIQTIRDDIQQQILSLPQNPRIKPIGQSGTFIISSADLMCGAGNRYSNWSASYHDFRVQYRALGELVQKGSPETIISRLNKALNMETVQAHLNGTVLQRVSLHPDVIKHVKALL